ncbi:hypothetical protein CHS0354_013114 [Potamilus streckersoni]|uniref:DNA polymerase delta subunit 4 n=1 Tax=Potamilus streckersoni TaxID=2493646 RepID=A0AAE0VRI9_9BIVA|nr:hypothetical protein CHS0354_013114 [Potamilus streckersoni]
MSAKTKTITDSFKRTKQVTSLKQKLPISDVKSSSSKDGSQREQDIAILKQFDLTLEFGPCIGVTRLERWMRAEKHGLNPPKDVKELLDQHINDPEYTDCLWKDYAI